MSHFTFRVFALLLTGGCLAAAAQPDTERDIIELSVGEQKYIQLTSSTPTGKPVDVIQVRDPNRDYLVVILTFEAGEAGAEHQLKVRNGYDHPVLFSTACTPSVRPDRLLIGAPSRGEAKMAIPSSTKRISLCDFTLALPSIF